MGVARIITHPPVRFLAALKCLSAAAAAAAAVIWRERRMAADGGKTAKWQKMLKKKTILFFYFCQHALIKTISLPFIYRISHFYFFLPLSKQEVAL